MSTQIIIKRLDGTKKPLPVDLDNTIAVVKKILSEKVGIASDQLRLIYQGHPLEDSITLTKAGIKTDDTIHMILQMRG